MKGNEEEGTVDHKVAFNIDQSSVQHIKDGEINNKVEVKCASLYNQFLAYIDNKLGK